MDKPRYSIDSGYTYFGQFIDHDLTNDRSLVEEAWKTEPEDLFNYQTPRLDLSHLYGRGPWDKDGETLYDGARFRVGLSAKCMNFYGGKALGAYDIGVDDNCKPAAADKRVFDNPIIRQLSAVFCHLHNFAVEQLRPKLRSDERELFEQARLLATWQFQRFVCEDYLVQVLDPSIYQQVFVERRPLFQWNRFSTPIEFTTAAMRFGHSMPRDKYFLGGDDRDLTELMDKCTEDKPLTPDTKIDWGRFFQNASTTAPAPITAQPIDTAITSALIKVDVSVVWLYSLGLGGALNSILLTSQRNSELVQTQTAIRVPVPFMSLCRGAGLRLPSGQEVARMLGEKVLTDQELVTDYRNDQSPGDQGKVLMEAKMLTHTPLWYYILKESEVRHNGSWLGPIGSRIIAETIFAALLHDPDSYLNHPQAEAARTRWDFAKEPRTLYKMCDLLIHADELAAA